MNDELRMTNCKKKAWAVGKRRIFFSSFIIRRWSFLFLASLASCNGPDQQWGASPSKTLADPPEPPPVSNIVRVNKFFSQNPWLSFKNDGSGNIDGVSFTVYLEGASQPRGVFGTGTIVVTMYRLSADPVGREVVVPVHEWVLPPDKAYPWRSKRPSAMGWGYGLRLQWPDTVNVGGKQISFTVKYIREDGREISSSRQVLKVPIGGSQAAPAAAIEKPVAKPAPSRAQ